MVSSRTLTAAPRRYEATPPMSVDANRFVQDHYATLTQNQSGEHLRICRICLDGESNNDEDLESGSAPTESTPLHGRRSRKNPLIHPCRCAGSMAFVHVECLNRWRADSPRRQSHFECDICKYKYSFYRPWWAILCRNIFVLHALAIVVLCLLILGSSYLAKVVDVYVLGHTPQPDNEQWRRIHGSTFLWLDRVYLSAGASLIAILGLVYLVYLGAARRCDTLLGGCFYDGTGCLCLNCGDCCGNGSSGSCCCEGCGACGDCQCACNDGMGAMGLLVAVGVLVLVVGLFGTLIAVYMVIEQEVQKMLSNIEELILDVPFN
ncbi:hypothetical protein BC938DRAFT_483635 [Jimgerdemannia flammicorona]|uniref:RING-CH-type domain-containing protein n=1 Tax=Jimgerdemannia flammicorona TaxID=994334 RepID=A0A433QBK8_9FUNG|nr:hypothetical protein BC938DRAFT_483635 [Jimgerdemannia flammicorona]